MNQSRQPRILSGVQPSGKLHLGNYFGAIKQHIALQEEGECFYFIADYHALTTIKEGVVRDADDAKKQGRKARPAAQLLHDQVLDVALDYLALGLDPARVAFFRQSDVPEVCELAWMLGTVTGMGLLERAHSFKDKTARGIVANVGLFTYPILMAADILIYRSNVVPVGKDQVQHLEMTRDMAGYFNQAVGKEIFPMPQERLDAIPVVPGTDGQKMSKSYGNTIDIFAEGKALQKSVMGIVSDSAAVEEPKNPDTCNIFQLLRLFAPPEELETVANRYRAGGYGYAEAKQLLLEKIDTYYAPARAKRKELLADLSQVEAVLVAGAAKARREAFKTMEKVRKSLGMLPAPVGKPT
ncbi:MAG: tryptophan--tRNA ligase [Zavarzinella sp.]